MTLIFNNGGIAGWLPAVNLFIFTYFLGMGGAIGIKILIFITTCGWGVYDFSIKNFEEFWEKQAHENLTFFENFTEVLDEKDYPKVSWFKN